MPLFAKEQVFLVTGASSGIGQGVALKLNQEGATVVAIARRADKLEDTKAQASAPENFFCEVKDLAEDIADLPKYMKSLKDKYGKLSGLAYCAGIARISPLQCIDFGEMKQMYDINAFAPIMMLKGFADRRVNAGKGSACVLFASIAAHISARGQIEYAGAKAAITAAAKSAAREIAPNGVRVNVISPADISTPMTHRDPDYLKNKANIYPLGVGEVADAAELAVFLLSKKSKWITAQDYVLDCGAY